MNQQVAYTFEFNPRCKCGKIATLQATKCNQLSCYLCHLFDFCEACYLINENNKLQKQKI